MKSFRRLLNGTESSPGRRALIWTVPAVALVMFAALIPFVALLLEVVDGRALRSTLTRPSVLEAIRFSVWQAVLSTAVTLTVGAAMAWILSRYEFRGRRLAAIVLTIPFVLPTVVVAGAFLALLPSSIERSLTSILLAHVFFNISVVIRLVGPTWSVVDRDLLSSARTLGASPTRIATRLVLPLAGPALTSAAALVFLMSFTSYGVVRILGGPGLDTVEVEIYRRAVLFGDVPGAAVLALAQTVVILVVFAIVARGRTPNLQRASSNRQEAPRWAAIISFVVSAAVSMPIIAMVLGSVVADGRWTLAGWANVLGMDHPSSIDVDVVRVTLRSIGFAVGAAAIAVPAGVAAAIGLSRTSGRWTRTIVVVPVSTSAVAIGFGILVAYDSDPFDFRSAWWLIPVVHAVVALPFVVRSALPVVQSIPQGLRDAARVLGASPWRAWWRVDAPLLGPALSTALGLSAALSLGEFGASSFLTRRATETLPIVIDRLLGRAGDLAFTSAMATSTVLLALTGLLVAVFDSTGNRSTNP